MVRWFSAFAFKQILGLEFTIWNIVLGGLGFGVGGLGFGVWGLGFGVWGLGFRV